MMPRRLKYVIGTLFVLRVIVSFILSDGLLKSDSITYFGAVVNLGLNGSIASIQPEDEARFRRGADPVELYEHLAGLSHPLYRPLLFQWLHAALYAPILFFWRSITPVILINNFLFFAAGVLVFRIAARQTSVLAQSVGWIVYAFFPPFFYLTSQFFSEPLFLFLFAATVLLIDKLGLEQFFYLFIVTATASLTRPFGLIVAAALICYAVMRTNYARAAGLFGALMLAVGINAVVMDHAVPENARVFSIPAAETFYLTNTAEGNGDFDYYLNVPEAALRDSALQRYRTGVISGLSLMAEAVRQNLRAPALFVKNGSEKLCNYFFSIVPDRWIYPSMHPQTPGKRFAWIAMNLVFFALAGAGLARAHKDAASLYLYLFAVSLVFHFLLLARYRYFLPMLVYASAFIPLAVDRVIARRSSADGKNKAPDHTK